MTEFHSFLIGTGLERRVLEGYGKRNGECMFSIVIGCPLFQKRCMYS
jgi:hypothetical protein